MTPLNGRSEKPGLAVLLITTISARIAMTHAAPQKMSMRLSGGLEPSSSSKRVPAVRAMPARIGLTHSPVDPRASSRSNMNIDTTMTTMPAMAQRTGIHLHSTRERRYAVAIGKMRKAIGKTVPYVVKAAV